MRFLRKSKDEKIILVVSDLHLGAGMFVKGRKNCLECFHSDKEFVEFLELYATGDYVRAEVELVMPMHNTGFCANCTRIRLTAGGYVKGCLFDRECVEDLLEPLREGEGLGELKRRIMTVVSERKPYWNDTDTMSETYERGRGT